MTTNGKKILVVVDMQNDFVTGALGTKEAQAIVPKVCEKIREFGEQVYFTQDTHGEDYLETQEGKHLPVKHCVKGTWGWELEPQVDALRHSTPIEKNTFGSKGLADVLKARNTYEGPLEEIELIGYLCDLQRAVVESLSSGGETGGGCQLLRRRDAGKPPAGLGRHGSLPNRDCKRIRAERSDDGENHMKHLYFIGGPMGGGKTTVCQKLKKLTAPSVFLDGDWCWDMEPFQVTQETKAMVQENIQFLLGQYLRCPAYETVIFCWVMHQQEIIDDLLGNLPLEGVKVHAVSLLAHPDTLRQRIGRDVEQGLRSWDVLDRSLARLPLYQELDTKKLWVDNLTPEQAAEKLAALK